MDKSWIQDCLYDIIFSKLTLKQIANKYDRCESAIKKMAQGRANK